VTWRLHKIVLFSHDGRRHHLPEKGFNENGVSVVIGDSNTGKSAILEIVNYCLGSPPARMSFTLGPDVVPGLNHGSPMYPWEHSCRHECPNDTVKAA
jgi:hypothetical protein